MPQAQSRSLFSLYLAYFADYFCWGAAIAFIAVYLSDAQTTFQEYFWSQQVTLGIALAAFPIGEVIGSPILGDLSDWIGRKKVLIWGLWGSIFSMGLCALALWQGYLFLFILGQLLTGFFAGKQAMAQAAIVEIHAGSKGQKLAFLSVIGGIAWILGPFLGGLLMEDPFKSYGGLIWPSLLASAVFVISLLCTQFFFTDTYQPKARQITTPAFLKSILDLFLVSWKEKLFFLFLLNLLGWYLLAISLSDFLVARFHLTEAQIGFFNSYLSLCFTVGGIIGTVWILHRWKAKNILFWSLIIGSIGLLLLFGIEKIIELWTYLAIPALTEAWIYPAYQTVLSDHTSEKNQGKLFGLIGASNGACQFIAAIVLGGGTSQSSILIAALLFLASAAFLPLLIRKKTRDRFSAKSS
jgi:MFS family permease